MNLVPKFVKTNKQDFIVEHVHKLHESSWPIMPPLLNLRPALCLFPVSFWQMRLFYTHPDYQLNPKGSEEERKRQAEKWRSKGVAFQCIDRQRELSAWYVQVDHVKRQIQVFEDGLHEYTKDKWTRMQNASDTIETQERRVAVVW